MSPLFPLSTGSHLVSPRTRLALRAAVKRASDVQFAHQGIQKLWREIPGAR